ALDLFRELLEVGTRGAAASGAARDLGREAADLEGLEHLLRDVDLLRAVTAGRRGETDPDGVADPFLEEDGEPRGGGHDPLRSHPRLGEPEMEGVIAAGGEAA